MSVPKVLGLENEYGMQALGYEGERILRPFGRSRRHLVPRTAVLESVAADVIHLVGRLSKGWHRSDAARAHLPNGGLIYRDIGAHPEYATPECFNPIDVVIHDRAGERAFATAAKELTESPEFQQRYPAVDEVHLYKNNVDMLGNTFGTHENYAIDSSLSFDELEQHLLTFLSTRPLIAGSGGVIVDRTAANGYRFVLSPRASKMEVAFGSRTLSHRPIYNMKDEPLADASRYRRAHLLCGDATRCDAATLLKIGSTAIVLAMIEAGYLPRFLAGTVGLTDLALRQPVASLNRVSDDPTGTVLLERRDGSTISPLEIQRLYLAAAQSFAADVGLESCGGDAGKHVLAYWERAVQALEHQQADTLYGVLDWPTRLRILTQDTARRREVNEPANRIGLAARMIDLRFAELRPDSLFEQLRDRGHIERIHDREPSLSDPGPTDTRAFIRGTTVSQWAGDLHAMDWDRIVIRQEYGVINITMPEPLLEDEGEIKALTEYPHLPFLEALGAASPGRIIELARTTRSIFMIETLRVAIDRLVSTYGEDPRYQVALSELGRSAVNGLREEILESQAARIELFLTSAAQAFHRAGTPHQLLTELRAARNELDDATAALEAGAATPQTSSGEHASGSPTTQWRRVQRARNTMHEAIVMVEQGRFAVHRSGFGQEGVGK